MRASERRGPPLLSKRPPFPCVLSSWNTGLGEVDAGEQSDDEALGPAAGPGTPPAPRPAPARRESTIGTGKRGSRFIRSNRSVANSRRSGSVVGAPPADALTPSLYDVFDSDETATVKDVHGELSATLLDSQRIANVSGPALLRLLASSLRGASAALG